MPTHTDQASADKLRALAHPLRIALVRFLGEPAQLPKSVTEIYQGLDIAQAVASQNLVLLKNNGILKSEKVGTKILYTVAGPWPMQVLSVLDKQAA